MFMRLGTMGRMIYAEGIPRPKFFHFVAHFARHAEAKRRRESDEGGIVGQPPQS
jgi:hypothetical protein